jgi:type IV secretion system protein VirB10
VLRAGTRIPLTVMSTVSSKNAAPGDQLYLQTMIPVAVDRRIIIPAGSYITGSVTQAKRPGKVSGRGELAVKFDSMMLPNGVTVDLTGRLGAMDGANPGELDRTEGKVKSDGGAGRDAMVVGGTTVGGTAMGNWIGDHGTAAGIGAAAGAATGLAAVLLTRGPEAVLERGATVEMQLNRDLKLAEDEVDSSPGAPPRAAGPKPRPAQSGTIPTGIPRGIPRW